MMASYRRWQNLHPRETRGFLSEVHCRSPSPGCDSRSQPCLVTGLRRALGRLYGNDYPYSNSAYPKGIHTTDYFYDILCTLTSVDLEFQKLEDIFSSFHIRRGTLQKGLHCKQEDLAYLEFTAKSLLNIVNNLKRDLISNLDSNYRQGPQMRSEHTRDLLNVIEGKLHNLLKKLIIFKGRMEKETYESGQYRGCRNSSRPKSKRKNRRNRRVSAESVPGFEHGMSNHEAHGLSSYPTKIPRANKVFISNKKQGRHYINSVKCFSDKTHFEDDRTSKKQNHYTEKRGHEYAKENHASYIQINPCKHQNSRNVSLDSLHYFDDRSRQENLIQGNRPKSKESFKRKQHKKKEGKTVYSNKNLVLKVEMNSRANLSILHPHITSDKEDNGSEVCENALFQTKKRQMRKRAGWSINRSRHSIPPRRKNKRRAQPRAKSTRPRKNHSHFSIKSSGKSNTPKRTTRFRSQPRKQGLKKNKTKQSPFRVYSSPRMNKTKPKEKPRNVNRDVADTPKIFTIHSSRPKNTRRAYHTIEKKRSSSTNDERGATRTVRNQTSVVRMSELHEYQTRCRSRRSLRQSPCAQQDCCPRLEHNAGYHCQAPRCDGAHYMNECRLNVEPIPYPMCEPCRVCPYPEPPCRPATCTPTDEVELVECSLSDPSETSCSSESIVEVARRERNMSSRSSYVLVRVASSSSYYKELQENEVLQRKKNFTFYKNIFYRHPGKRSSYVRMGKFLKESRERVFEYNEEYNEYWPIDKPKETYSRGTSTETVAVHTKNTSTEEIVRVLQAVGTNTEMVDTRERGVDAPSYEQPVQEPKPEVKTEFTNTDRITTRTTGTDSKPVQPKPKTANTATDPLRISIRNRDTNTDPEKKKTLTTTGTDAKPEVKVEKSTVATDPLYYLSQKAKATNTSPVTTLDAGTEALPRPVYLDKVTSPLKIKTGEKQTSYDKVKTTERGVSPVQREVEDKGQQFDTAEEKPEVKHAFTGTETQPMYGKMVQTSFQEPTKEPRPSLYTKETQTRYVEPDCPPPAEVPSKPPSIPSKHSSDDPPVIVVHRKPPSSDISMHLVFQKSHEEIYKTPCAPVCGRRRKILVCERTRSERIVIPSKKNCGIPQQKDETIKHDIDMSLSMDTKHGRKRYSRHQRESDSRPVENRGPRRTKLCKPCGMNENKRGYDNPTHVTNQFGSHDSYLKRAKSDSELGLDEGSDAVHQTNWRSIADKVKAEVDLNRDPTSPTQ